MIALEFVRVGLLAALVATVSVGVVKLVRQPPTTIVVLRAPPPAHPTAIPVCAYWHVRNTPWSVDMNPYCGYWRD